MNTHGRRTCNRKNDNCIEVPVKDVDESKVFDESKLNNDSVEAELNDGTSGGGHRKAKKCASVKRSKHTLEVFSRNFSETNKDVNDMNKKLPEVKELKANESNVKENKLDDNMGNIEQYHILLTVDKQQEQTIKRLYVKEKWTYACQNISAEVVKKIQDSVNSDSDFDISHKAAVAGDGNIDTSWKYSSRQTHVQFNEQKINVGNGHLRRIGKRKKKDVLDEFQAKDNNDSELKNGMTKSELNNKNAQTEIMQEILYTEMKKSKHELKNDRIFNKDCIETGKDIVNVSKVLSEVETSEFNVRDNEMEGNVKDTHQDSASNVQLSASNTDTEDNFNDDIAEGSDKDTALERWTKKNRVMQECNVSGCDFLKIPTFVFSSNRPTFRRRKRETILAKNKRKPMKLKSLPKPVMARNCGDDSSDGSYKCLRFGDEKLSEENLPIQCAFCEGRFAMEKYLKKHVNRVHPNKSMGMFCEYCSANFKRRPDLYAHIKEAHPQRRIKNIQCDLCGNVFRSKGSYDEHRKAVHTDVRAFTCEVCNKAYKSLRVLKIHLLRHGPANEICNVCGKTFRLKSEVKHHMRRHMNDRRIQCDSCDKVFYRNSELKNHMRIHTGEKPYKCNQCQYACTIKGNLDKHMKTHEKTGNNQMSSSSGRKPIIKSASAPLEVPDASQGSSKRGHLMADLWNIPDMEQQERAAVETIHQWQMKGFEVVQNCEALIQMHALATDSSGSTVPQQLVLQEHRNLNPESLLEESLYTRMQAPALMQNNTKEVMDVVANASPAAGIEILYAENSNVTDDTNDTKPELTGQWQISNEDKTNIASLYHHVYPYLMPKLPEMTISSHWQSASEKPGSLVLLQQPLYTQLKPGETIKKEDVSILSWPVMTSRRDTGSVPQGLNQLVLQNLQGNYF